jgi:hypothetical protein
MQTAQTQTELTMQVSKFFDHTVYPRQAKSTVGITFKPTPSMTEDDLRQLITDLCKVGIEMEDARKGRN